MLPSVCSITKPTRAIPTCVSWAAADCQNYANFIVSDGLQYHGPVTRCLILAAGRFDPVTLARAALSDREPRLDVFELACALSADVLDFQDVDAARSPLVRATHRALRASAPLPLRRPARALLPPPWRPGAPAAPPPPPRPPPPARPRASRSPPACASFATGPRT